VRGSHDRELTPESGGEGGEQAAGKQRPGRQPVLAGGEGDAEPIKGAGQQPGGRHHRRYEREPRRPFAVGGVLRSAGGGDQQYGSDR
jgi:hypothetical protein